MMNTMELNTMELEAVAGGMTPEELEHNPEYIALQKKAAEIEALWVAGKLSFAEYHNQMMEVVNKIWQMQLSITQ